MSGRGFDAVLASAPAQGEDLGLRARRIKFMVQAEYPPQLRSLPAKSIVGSANEQRRASQKGA